MAAIKVQYYQSPVGELELGVYDNTLCLCNWRNKKNRQRVHNRLQNYFNVPFEQSSHPVIDQTKSQLELYFQGKLQQFDLPFSFAGTGFQQRVWQALLTVPYGQTISYLQLAEQIQEKQACRAVANANAANALSIIVPCHRVIGSNGQLTGYAGGVETKQKLLNLEGYLVN